MAARLGLFSCFRGTKERPPDDQCSEVTFSADVLFKLIKGIRDIKTFQAFENAVKLVAEATNTRRNMQGQSITRQLVFCLHEWQFHSPQTCKLRHLVTALRHCNLMELASSITLEASTRKKERSSDSHATYAEEKLYVIEKIGVNYHKLGMRLGLSAQSLKVIDAENNLIFNRSAAVLTKWEEINGNNATREILLQKLKKIEQLDIAHAIEEGFMHANPQEAISCPTMEEISNEIIMTMLTEWGNRSDQWIILAVAAEFSLEKVVGLVDPKNVSDKILPIGIMHTWETVYPTKCSPQILQERLIQMGETSLAEIVHQISEHRRAQSAVPSLETAVHEYDENIEKKIWLKALRRELPNDMEIVLLSLAVGLRPDNILLLLKECRYDWDDVATKISERFPDAYKLDSVRDALEDFRSTELPIIRIREMRDDGIDPGCSTWMHFVDCSRAKQTFQLTADGSLVTLDLPKDCADPFLLKIRITKKTKEDSFLRVDSSVIRVRGCSVFREVVTISIPYPDGFPVKFAEALVFDDVIEEWTTFSTKENMFLEANNRRISFIIKSCGWFVVRFSTSTKRRLDAAKPCCII